MTRNVGLVHQMPFSCDRNGIPAASLEKVSCFGLPSNYVIYNYGIAYLKGLSHFISHVYLKDSHFKHLHSVSTSILEIAYKSFVNLLMCYLIIYYGQTSIKAPVDIFKHVI